MKKFLALMCAALFAGCGTSDPVSGLFGQPEVTDNIRDSCYWVDETYLGNAVDTLSMDRDAGFSAQQELQAFTNACINSCKANGGDAAKCSYNCTNCGMALVNEVW